MKHNMKVVVILICLFLIAQFIGLGVLNAYYGQELPFGVQRPEFQEEVSYVSLFIVILFAAGLALVLTYFKADKLWRTWFFLSVLFTLMISFGSFLNQWVALVLAFILTSWRLFKNNVIVHNFTEVFVYGGLAAIFVPILNLFSVSVLLVLISIYDMIAVWKTKHMIKMAKYQAKLKIFAGMVIPYGKKEAILGGGDIGFALLFAGVIMFSFGLLEAVITSFCSAIALFILFMMADKKKFYPAMPFISAGCFIGLLISVLI